MEILRIKVIDTDLDLFENTKDSFYINKSSHQLQDLTTRNAQTTKSLSIPRTKNNIKAFAQYLPSLRGSLEVRTEFIPCSVFVMGFPSLQNAVIVINSEDVENNTIGVSIYGGEVEFFNRLSDDSIRKLDWGREFNFRWNLANLEPFATTTEGFGFFRHSHITPDSYAIAIEEGALNSELKFDSLDINFCGGWMYTKTIVNKILDGIEGYTFDTSKIEDYLYDNLLLGLPITQSIEGFKNSNEGNEGAEVSAKTSNIFGSPVVDSTTYLIEFDTIEANEPAGAVGGTNDYLQAKEGEGNYDIELDLSGSVYAWQSGTDIVRKQPYYVNNDHYGRCYYILSNSPTVEREAKIMRKAGWNYEVIKHSIQLEANEQVRFYYESPTYYGLNGLKIFHNANIISSASLSKAGKTSNFFFRMKNYLPDISQKDFIKNIFNQFNIVLNEKNNVITFSHFRDVSTNPEIDITRFHNGTKPTVTAPRLGGWATDNYFSYAEGAGNDASATASTISILDDTLPTETNKLVSKFQASDQLRKTDGRNMANTSQNNVGYHEDSANRCTTTSGSNVATFQDTHPLKVGDILYTNGQRKKVKAIDSSTVVRVDVNFSGNGNNLLWQALRYEINDKCEIPLGFVKDETPDGLNQTVYDGGSSRTGYISQKIVKFDSLHMDKVIAEYYPTIKQALKSPKVVTAYFTLPIVIFDALNSNNPVFFNNKKYYLNKIEQYKVNGECRIELINIR
jgi:hypothetical protein